MANNSPGGIKGFAKDVGEAVGEPVRDEFQRAVEQGVASVTGKTPQDLQNNPQFKQKQLQDQKRVQNIKQFFAQMSAQEQQLKQQKIQESQKKQEEVQVEQEKKQVKQFQVAKKRQVMTDLAAKQRQVEIKKGGF